jgi:hypothetical protein
MQYKKITLELLSSQPPLRAWLQGRRLLLPAMNHYAEQLKARHEAWMQTLAAARPGSAPLQNSSEALELAVEEIRAGLPSESELRDETFSLEEALGFLTTLSSGD